MRAAVRRWWSVFAGMALLFAPAHVAGEDDADVVPHVDPQDLTAAALRPNGRIGDCPQQPRSSRSSARLSIAT